MREDVTRAEAGTAAGATPASGALSPRAVILLTAAVSMLQPLATDLYLPTLPGIARYFQTDVSTAQWTLSIFIGVLGLTTTAFGFAFATMVSGYLVGTLICRQQLPRRGLQGTIIGGASLQLAAGASLALLALASVHHPLAIVVQMFFYGVSHGILQSPAQSGAIAPFAANAGAAAALLGFVMMLIAALVGVWIGFSFNGTVYPLTLTIGAISIASALIAFTLVRRDGDVAHHG